MTPGQTHPRRRGLNELMESVAAKLAERPDHIAAARVLEEMQADAAKISHKADDVDVQNGQSEVSSSSSSSSSSSVDAQIDSPECPDKVDDQNGLASGLATEARSDVSVKTEIEDMQNGQPELTVKMDAQASQHSPSQREATGKYSETSSIESLSAPSTWTPIVDTLSVHSKVSPVVPRPDGRKRPYQVDVQNRHSEYPDKRSSHHEELPERKTEPPVENRLEAGTSTEQGTSASRKHDQEETVPVQAAEMTLRSPTSDTLNGRSRRTAKVDVQTGARCKPKRVGEGQISLLRPLAPVHGANPTKLFKWLYGIGKKETIDLTLPIIEETIGIDARTCRRIIATWAETGVCEKTVHRRGMRIRLLMDEKEALGAPRAASPSVSASPADELERALPELCPRLMEVGFTAKHLRRIKELLAVQNIDPGSLTDALRYAEYELEHGQMVDSKGQPVSRPVDWVFRCLSKDGTYRIPTGYVSPAELRRREREEAVRREREALEAERRLLEEEAALALEKEVEAMFRQLRRPVCRTDPGEGSRCPAFTRGVGEPAGAEGLPDADQLYAPGRRRSGAVGLFCVSILYGHTAWTLWVDSVPVRDACGCAWTGSPAGRPGQRVRAGCPDMLDTQSVRGCCERPVRQDRMAAHAGQSYWRCPGHSDREKRL